MLPPRLANRLTRAVRSVIASGSLNTSPVILRWRDPSAPEPIPGIETSADPAAVERTAEVQALVHYVSIGSTGSSQFTKFEKGDVILDFPGDVDLDTKPDLRFEIGGKIYVQKATGTELAESWDVRCNGVPVTRTVLVTLLG